MKRYLLLTALVLATTAQADFWDNCTAYGGTIITANSYGNDKGGLCNDPNDTNLTNNCNGKRFCMSGNKMNWWSAFTWCNEIDGTLVSFSNLCPGKQTINSGTCANIKEITQTVWTSTAWAQNKVIAMWSNGKVGDNYRDHTDFSALCEE